MKNKLITALGSIGLALTMSITVTAAPLSDLNKQKSDLQQKQNQNSSQISNVNKQISDMESSIESYDNQISAMTVKLNDTKSKISSAQTKIEKAQSALEKAQNDYNAQQKLLDDRIKVIYVNGSESYIGFLLDSKGLGDFVSRIETVKQISQLDKQVMTDLETEQEQIKTEKQTMDAQKAQLVKLQNDQQSTLNKLNAQKSQEATVVAQYNAKKADLLKNDSQYKAQIEATNKQIQEATAALQKVTSNVNVPSDPVYTGSATAIQIIAYARQFLGKPYYWGGNGPDVFDCSGFTKYVFAYFGITLPRRSEDQCSVGKMVSRSQLQMGDLVFFMNSSGDVHHVGIYVGGGCYINAPHSGDVVKIAPLDPDFVYGRRII